MSAPPELQRASREPIALGIDLGTTNSVVAVVRGGHVEVIPDAEGHRLHPSVVTFKPSGETVVGLGARLRRIVDPQNTVFSVKRILGQPFRSPAAQNAIRQLPYRVVEGQNQEPLIVTRAGKYSAVDLAAMVLAHLRQLAENHLGELVTDCVITVPASFSDSQREATRQAADRAGLTVLRLLNEPTAAALAHGYGRRAERRLVVYDFGGGTFDCTVLAVRDALFEVVATGGDTFLGGDDMDRALAEHLALSFLEKHRVDLTQAGDTFARLLVASEQIKARLTKEPAVAGTLSELAYGEGGAPLSLDFDVSRDKFATLIAPIVERTITTADLVLHSAGVDATRIDEVLLVGGSTRVPLVRERVQAHFGKPAREDLNPMEVVAHGAALQAAMLVGATIGTPGSVEAAASASAPPLLLDVTPHALGLALAGGFTDVIVEKNAPIPTERTRLFATAHDNQTDVILRVCQGDQRVFTDNAPLGELRLTGLRAAPRGQVRIEVSFLVDADGILQVAARDVETGRSERVTLRVLGVAEAAA